MQKKSFEQTARITIDRILCEPEIAPMMEQLKKHSGKTFIHSLNVAFIAVQMGINRNFNHNRIDNLARGALLHDIGKLSITAALLNSDKALTAEEYDIIKTHPEEGCKLVKDCGFDSIVIDIIRHHHEKKDGSGYPDGVDNTELGIEVNLVCVADVWDAMTSERSYKPEYTGEIAEVELRELCASYYDPEAVRLLFMCPDR